MDNLETNENNKGDSQDKEIADLRAQITALQEENLILQEPNKDLTKSVDEQLRNQFGILKFKESDSDIYSFRFWSIGAYGPVAERIKVHCFFAKTVGTFPVFVGSVPFLLCRVNAPCVSYD